MIEKERQDGRIVCVSGSQVILVIDPGDNAYPEKFTAAYGAASANVASVVTP